jgi:hypothetical protein
MSLFLDFLVFILTFIGFGALSASMDRHAKQIFGETPRPRIRLLRTVVGWAALTLALVPAIHAYGLATGIAVWFGFLAVSATALGLLLTYRPKTLLLFLAVITLAGSLLKSRFRRQCCECHLVAAGLLLMTLIDRL